MTPIKDPGPYARHRGVEYELTRLDGQPVLLSFGTEAPAPEWQPKRGIWVLPVGPGDVEEVASYSYPGTYRGAAVDVGRTPREQYQLWARRGPEATAAGFTEWYDQWLTIKLVDIDDPELTFREVRTVIDFPYGESDQHAASDWQD